MATTDSTREQPAYRRPESLRFPSRWVESLRFIAILVVFGLLVTAIPVTTVLGILTIAPIAGSVAGTAGLLAVWLAGIGLVAATPELARRCLDAVTRIR